MDRNELTVSSNQFLLQYSLIPPDRVQRYEDVFNDCCSRQENKYDRHFNRIYGFHPLRKDRAWNPNRAQETSHNAAAAEGPKIASSTYPGEPLAAGEKPEVIKLSEEEKLAIMKRIQLSRSTASMNTIAGFSDGDWELSRLQFNQKVLNKKLLVYRQRLNALKAELRRCLVAEARRRFPTIKSANYESPSSSKKKKKKTGKQKSAPASGAVLFVPPESDPAAVEELDEASAADLDGVDILESPSMLNNVNTTPSVQQPGEVADDVVYQRIMEDPSVLETLMLERRLGQLQLEASRLEEKLAELQARLRHSQEQECRVLAYSNDDHDCAEHRDSLPPEKHREQSATYRRLHPEIDRELNVDSLAETLQQINGKLISSAEIQYICLVLELPGKKRINLKMFAVLAALSEKIVHLDPTIRRVIKDIDFEELIGNIERAKELFQLLSDAPDDAPEGYVTVTSLVIELTAGGIPRHIIQYLVSKLNRKKNGLVDLLDFMTYVPLFMDIHRSIVRNPLASGSPDHFKHMIEA